MKKLSLILCLISLSGAFSCCAMGWHEAAENENIEELKRLSKTDRQNITKTYQCGNTQLHYVIFTGDVDTVESLLKNGALPLINQPNDNGDTPLHMAVTKSSFQIAKILLGAGAKTRVHDNRGFSPLHHAASVGNIAIISLLLSEGDRPYIDNFGLRQKPDDFRPFGGNPSNPLQLAAMGGHVDAVRILLLNGALPVMKDMHYLNTPLQLAERAGHTAIVQLLRDAESKLNK